MIIDYISKKRHQIANIKNTNILLNKNNYQQAICNICDRSDSLYYFYGPIECYNKFNVSPCEVPYSTEENDFRISCLKEELEELRVANDNNDTHEYIDAIVDLLFFAIGTSYRKNIILEAATMYSSFNESNKINLLYNGNDFDILYKTIEKYIELIDKQDDIALFNLISLCITYLNEEYNPDIINYYIRVTAANKNKIIGPNQKRGSFSLDLVKPDDWSPPSFEGLLL